jgi:hypothetical protein
MIACGTLAAQGSGVGARCATLPTAALAPTSGDCAPATCITAPQTEQRARTPPVGTFVGSTRKTD